MIEKICNLLNANSIEDVEFGIKLFENYKNEHNIAITGRVGVTTSYIEDLLSFKNGGKWWPLPDNRLYRTLRFTNKGIDDLVGFHIENK